MSSTETPEKKKNTVEKDLKKTTAELAKLQLKFEKYRTRVREKKYLISTLSLSKLKTLH